MPRNVSVTSGELLVLGCQSPGWMEMSQPTHPVARVTTETRWEGALSSHHAGECGGWSVTPNARKQLPVRFREYPSNQMHNKVTSLLLHVSQTSYLPSGNFSPCSEMFLVPRPSPLQHPALGPGPHPLAYPKRKLQTHFKEPATECITFFGGKGSEPMA